MVQIKLQKFVYQVTGLPDMADMVVELYHVKNEYICFITKLLVIGGALRKIAMSGRKDRIVGSSSNNSYENSSSDAEEPENHIERRGRKGGSV
ncbi:hypothetical protein CDAR_319521 [Caerostris darwini]|uniref:Uncharacterized protein n=1 Tax=Caerostris darwini TaxID=1538125 RepID=A0AAV4V8S0_9ARAC|nr:hypothetical protein CDAR_319521 [Caerostris darwini]